MASSDLMFTPAGELAARVRGGELSARELVQASLDRIEALDGALNAFVEVDGERALAAADEVQPGDTRPFAGVPIAVKANVPVEGLCMNFGSKFLSGHRPGHSAYLVRRLREAGFVVVGVTNLPEFGILPTTEPRHTGPTRNPWDLSRTPGGSSGGAAAAVAAGLVPVAHGNDGLGSIRGPAACCGLIGFKPGYGTVPAQLGADSRWGLAENGVLATSVADTALLLSVLAGDPELAALEDMERPQGLRVALSVSPLSPGFPVDREYRNAVSDVGALLEAAGHQVDRAGRYPAYLGPGAMLTWY